MQTENIFSFDQVSVSCDDPPGYSRVRRRLGYPTGYEPNEQVDDMTSLNFASIQGESGTSSNTSSSTCSVTELAASTIPGTDTTIRAPIDRLGQQERGHRFSPREKRTTNHQKHSATSQASRSRSSSSAATPTRRTVGAATVGSTKTTPC